ncbi:hypothetical protein ACQP2T_29740 [Nonomuraea sp. CA-143628]|uniref:hypothetical protein n=1 Tax=Nonomuraea sp. CA-143628 TaxID=3239997 RepID=UPI003D8ED91D
MGVWPASHARDAAANVERAEQRGARTRTGIGAIHVHQGTGRKPVPNRNSVADSTAAPINHHRCDLIEQTPPPGKLPRYSTPAPRAHIGGESELRTPSHGQLRRHRR